MPALFKRAFSSRLEGECARPTWIFTLAFLIVALALVIPLRVYADSNARGSGSKNDLIVQTDAGKLQGFETKGIAEFLGVPFAAPPLSPDPTAKPCSPTNLRWCPPIAHAHWKGVRQATSFAMPCAQISEDGVYAGPPNDNEDCLYLDIYTPQLGAQEKSHAKVPVLIWFHGAGATSGESNDYDGSKLALQGRTVVVTVNFRLGLFGYLAHPALDNEGHLFANYQILDSLFAMHWVHDNIAKFGGDPNNVVLVGQSGGSQDAVTQMLSPLAKGLFTKIILESGPINPDSTPLGAGLQRGEAFAAAAGCGSGTGPDVAVCLRSLPASKIQQLMGNGVTYTTHGITMDTGRGPYTTFIMTDGQILPDDPVILMTKGEFTHVPILSGVVENEGAFSVAQVEYFETPRVPLTEAQEQTYVTNTFTGNAGPWATPPAYPAGTVQKVNAEYPLSAYPTPQQQWTAVESDAGNDCWAAHFAPILAPQVPLYTYEMRDQTMPFYFPAMPGYFAGAYHTGDQAYYFPLFHGGPLGIAHPLNAKQEVLSDQLVAAWSNFAWAGNPNGQGNSPWPRYSGKNGLWFTENIAPTGLSTETDAFFRAEHHCDFWEKILVYSSTEK